MRIFLSCQQALRRHAVPAYAFWEYYFKQGLAEASHEVIETPGVDWAEGLTDLNPAGRRQWLDATWTRTIKFITSEHARKGVDLFLAYLFPHQVEPRAIAAIRAAGIPCVNFFCDNVREFTAVPDRYKGFDLHWVPEADACELYTKAKLPFVHAPMPMWVPPALRSPSSIENSEVVFIGSHDPLREDLLGEAVSLGLQLKLHGDGWRSTGPTMTAAPRSIGCTIVNQFSFLRDHGLRGFAMRATYQMRHRRATNWIESCWQPAIHGDDYFRTLRESGVVLGINRYPSFRHSFSQPGRYSRLRDIEAPMLGACYLAEWAPGLEHLYEIGKEIETFKDAAELVEKTRLLLREPSRRAMLRHKGQERALNDHSLARSVERIAQRLGLRR